MKKAGLILFGFLLPFWLTAQQMCVDFDHNREELSREYRYVRGVKGQALDFSREASNRTPFSVECPDVDFNRDYTVIVWVKTIPGVCDAQKIISTIDPNEKSGGFSIESSASGSWGVQLGNGVNSWKYFPTVERQPIQDGRWHMLALTLNRSESEARMYYDGNNVAIYNTSEMGQFHVAAPLRIGGMSDESHAFNGYIDEVEIHHTVLTPPEIFRKYAAWAKVKETRFPQKVQELKLMGFNIWHGGRETGETVGVERVADLIRDSKADVIGMIETYGSGPEIADALGYYFYLHSSNLAIFSRYPIARTYDFYRPFNCSAATIQVSQTQQINFINLWLNYLPSTDEQVKSGVDAREIEKLEWTTRAHELKSILQEADSIVSGRLPVFVSGDFNIDSHLDWTEATKAEHNGYVIEWPTSKLMYGAGFIDSYRKLFPDPATHPCKTWSPVFKDELQYRIDFIYYKGDGVEVIDSRMVDRHSVRFPSDHAAMLSTFRLSGK